MMRYNISWFNAPSREAIYKAVMTLSEGESWTYDYEEFVAFDSKNIGSAKPRSAMTGHIRLYSIDLSCDPVYPQRSPVVVASFIVMSPFAMRSFCWFHYNESGGGCQGGMNQMSLGFR